MKKLFYIPLLFILLLNCKNDKIDTQPDEIMKPLVGKWYLAETEQMVNGEKVWVPFTALKAVYLNFRFDGLMLDENSKASCCAPQIYNINNTIFEVRRRAAVSYVADCSTLYCDFFCYTYDIEVAGNEMIISSCNSLKSKYFRTE